MSYKVLLPIAAKTVNWASVSTRLVATTLAHFIHIDANHCFPSIRKLMELTGLGRRTIYKAIRELEAHGVLIRVHRFRQDGGQTSTTYVFPDVPTDWARARYADRDKHRKPVVGSKVHAWDGVHEYMHAPRCMLNAPHEDSPDGFKNISEDSSSMQQTPESPYHGRADSPPPSQPSPSQQETHAQTAPPPPAGTGMESTARNADACATRTATPSADDLQAMEQALRKATGTENDPSPALFVMRPILELLAEGYGFHEHIMPAARAVAARGVRIRSWQYLVPVVREMAARGRENGGKRHAHDNRPVRFVAEGVNPNPDVPDWEWTYVAEYAKLTGEWHPKSWGQPPHHEDTHMPEHLRAGIPAKLKIRMYPFSHGEYLTPERWERGLQRLREELAHADA